MANNGNFSMRLQKVAISKKKSQADIARDLKKGAPTVNKWWKGDIIPGSKNMAMLADYLGCNFEWLRSGTGEMYDDTTNKSDTGQAINTGTAIVHGKGIGQVNIASVIDGKKLEPGRRLIEVSDFESEVIEGMRKYFPLARWEAIAAEIEAEKKKYG